MQELFVTVTPAQLRAAADDLEDNGVHFCVTLVADGDEEYITFRLPTEES